MALAVTVRVPSLTDERARRRTMETVADILGVDSIAVDMKDKKLTVVGGVDALVIVKKLKKFGKIEILSVGVANAKVEKKEEKKQGGEEKKGEAKKGGK